MAFARIAHVAAGSTNNVNVTTGGIDTTGANLIVISTVSYTPAAAPTISDSKGNTWTGLTSTYTSVLSRCRLYYCVNPTVGSGHTFTSAATAPALCVYAYSGGKATSPFDAENGAGVSPGTTVAPGTVTPSEDNELVVCGFGAAGTTTPTIGGGFTIRDHVPFVSGQCYACDLADLIQTSLAAANPTWTIGANLYSAAAIACFKAEPVAGGHPAVKRFGGIQNAHGGYQHGSGAMRW